MLRAWQARSPISTAGSTETAKPEQWQFFQNRRIFVGRACNRRAKPQASFATPFDSEASLQGARVPSTRYLPARIAYSASKVRR